MKVLLTGGTGFIGAHVAEYLLKDNHTVVLACRNEAKAKKFVEARPEKKHLIIPYIVEDFEKDSDAKNPFIAAAEGCDGIIHVASPFLAHATNVEEELLKPAIHGVQMILDAAYANKSVKRLVLTSSFASVLDLAANHSADFVYTAECWNPITYEEAKAANTVVGYRGSKKYAEKTAWDFLESHKDAQFDLATFCPPMVFGPVVHPVASVDQLNVSNASLYSTAQGANPLPEARVPVWIDVRDLAFAHYSAFIKEGPMNKRYVLSSPETYSYEWAAKIVYDKKLTDKVDPAVYEGKELHPKSYSLDWKSAQKDLGIEFHTFEECVVDSIKSFNKL